MSESGKERVAANIVTYNRKQLLCECLNALLEQTSPLDAIYIIDNASTDGTPEYLLENGFIDNPLYPDTKPLEAVKNLSLRTITDKTVSIHYVRMHENTGASGGQYEGIRRGYEKGFNWLWLMDDDVEPDKKCLQTMFEDYENEISKENKNIVCIVPQRIYPDGQLLPVDHEGILDKNIFSLELFKKRTTNYIEKMTLEGPLIKAKDAFKVSGDLRDYFILYDDIDIAFKLTQYAYILFSSKSIMRKKIKIVNDAYIHSNKWKQYYRYRNRLIFVRNNFKIYMLLAIISYYIREILRILRKPKRYGFLSVYIYALKDALFGKKGGIYTPDNNPWKTK